MALKRKLTAAEFAALTDALKEHYKQNGNDYVLDADDAGELQRALERERANVTTLTTQSTALQAEFNAWKDTHARNTGDVATLEASWKKKLKDKEDELGASIKKLQDVISKTLVDERANTLAAKLAGDNAAVLLPHIKSRLKADLTGDVPMTRVLDATGQLTALTVDELEKEFVANKSFGAIIIGSRASGSAAGTNGSGTTSVTQGKKKFGELSDAERTEWYNRDPKGFSEASQANQREVMDQRFTAR
jgi:hypothetical protein